MKTVFFFLFILTRLKANLNRGDVMHAVLSEMKGVSYFPNSAAQTVVGRKHFSPFLDYPTDVPPALIMAGLGRQRKHLQRASASDRDSPDG